MSNLIPRNSIPYTLRTTSLNPRAISQGAEEGITRASMEIHAPVPFFGDDIADVTERGELDSNRLINSSTLAGGGASRRAREAAGRSAVHEIFAQERAEEVAVANRFQAAKAQTEVYQKAIASHREQANQVSRDIAYLKRLCNTLRDARDSHGLAEKQQKMKVLKNKLSYHTAAAAEIQNLLNGVTDEMPGARRVTAIGNYEIESPIQAPVLTKKAKEVSNPKKHLIGLPKTKGVAVVEVTPPQKKETSKSMIRVAKPFDKKLPVAKHISHKIVAAEPPRDLAIPRAKARLA